MQVEKKSISRSLLKLNKTTYYTLINKQFYKLSKDVDIS